MKELGKFLLNLVEVYIPVFAFAVMFVIFVLQIFFRYVLNMPLTWPFEATMILFIWTAILGGAYTRRIHKHVSFTVIYDKLSLKAQMFVKIIGNIFISIIFLISIIPVYNYIQYISWRKSTCLRIPYNVIFFPFLILMLLIIGHCIYDVVKDIKVLRKE